MAIRQVELGTDRALNRIRLLADADKNQLPLYETFRNLGGIEKDFLLINELYRRCQGPNRIQYVPIHKTIGTEDRMLGATDLVSYVEKHTGIEFSDNLIMQAINRLRDSAEYQTSVTVDVADRIGTTLMISLPSDPVSPVEGYLKGLSDTEFGTLLRSEII